MKQVAILPALILVIAHIGSAHAQNAASVVTSATADATTRVVTEAVSGVTKEALKPEQKAEAMKKESMKGQAKKAEGAITSGKK